MNAPQRHVISHSPAGNWPVGEVLGSVTLAWNDRHRRRLAMTDDDGTPFLLDLPKAVLLADGDGLKVESGGWLKVKAAAEAVIDIEGDTPEALTRIAWHIGNRHAPLQILASGGLRILDDHVLVAMVEGLGGKVEHRQAPFHAESGAYETAVHGHAHAEAEPETGHGHRHGSELSG